MNKLRFIMPIGFLAVVAGFGLAVMLLWNWLMPSLFGLTTISFWQSVGIFILCRILFGSLGIGKHHRMHHHGRGFDGMRGMREQWQNMTPEQRKEFVDKQRERFSKRDFFGRPDFNSFATDENIPKENE